jgi:hypothetical protein
MNLFKKIAACTDIHFVLISSLAQLSGPATITKYIVNKPVEEVTLSE